ncbi:uncharacterized protein N7469_002639 [Penicillium citrinum]|uniref:HNH nuclease domain-containing protein n=1 Tax=Penicillium citrinum TaxID=5077 RepID=A0A9W9PD23_PENCI|nr:uncharacterized protein N7469_002639 [Penicillium citrinum]KAJ5241048.1 hypothetical protein N7469_002639 [Penicillium citrinum]
MSRIPEVPPVILSRLPKSLYDDLVVRRQRNIDLSQNTQDYRCVSDFLEDRIKLLTNDIQYIESAHRGLGFALDNLSLSAKEFRDALRPFIPPSRLISKELRNLKRQKKLISEDLEDEVAVRKRQRTGPSATGLYLRAYTDSMLQRVMAACGKRKPQKTFNARQFKHSVNEYYGIEKGSGFCQIIGCEFIADDVKAAHIVPKSLTGEEISYLFGGEIVVSLDPRNGWLHSLTPILLITDCFALLALSLHKRVEEGLDRGDIVVLPISQAQDTGDTEIPSKWKCVLVDQSKRGLTVTRMGGIHILWGDIDGNELAFLNDNRPAKRYLYFRFVMTYLHWKKNGILTPFVSNVETVRQFWPTPGPYLRQSMLCALARNISGVDLPNSLVQDRTFNDDEYPPLADELAHEPAASGSITASIIAASDIENAMLASMRNAVSDSEASCCSCSSTINQDDEDRLVFEDCME